MSHYHTVDEMIAMIDEPYFSGCQRILADNRLLFQKVQGSLSNHQAWVGGYFDHVQEVMNLAILLYKPMNAARPLPFSLSDLLLVVFLHDLEKPWKYDLDEEGQLRHRPGMETKEQHHAFRLQKLAEYKIELTPELKNGIQYVEGEIHDYSPHTRKMGPLATLAHMCDVASARLWFDYPMAEHDPWQGAGRPRD